MDDKEKEVLMKNHKDEIINVNGEDYVKAEVFMNAIYNVSLLEAIVGAMAKRVGKVELDSKEIIDIMANDYSNFNMQFSKDKCVIDTI